LKPISVNVDFEEVLSGKPARLSLRASVEFLALWVQDRPLLASRPYSESYLKYVSAQIGHPVSATTQGEADEWWGETAHKELMRKLSSKTEFKNWWYSRWPLEARNCFSWKELEAIVQAGQWLIKKSDGMSGRGHQRVTREELPSLRSRLEKTLSLGVVVEPLYQRTRDVSALWLSEEKRFIYYANLIDERFQWRGTILNRDSMSEVPAATQNWGEHLVELQKYVSGLGYHGPFSVDAFFYQTAAGETFHPGSEMNPRKTMGWVTYQLWKKNKMASASLALVPLVLNDEAWMQVAQIPEAQLLSPVNCPFTWYWLEADSAVELEIKRSAFLTKLPEVPVRDKV
jgi:hypothetical protein